MTERTNILKDGNEGIMMGYEGLDQPFFIKTSCISISYSGFMKGEGLTHLFSEALLGDKKYPLV